MSQPAVTIHWDRPDHDFRPGDVLSGSYQLSGAAPDELSAAEVSVLWHSEGKGDEDLAVHSFERLTTGEGFTLSPQGTAHFSTLLPSSPLSYEGVIVKIRWCVRVRLYLKGGREVLAEAPFRLGKVPPARAVLR